MFLVGVILLCFVPCFHAALGEQAAESLSTHPDKCQRLQRGRKIPTWRSEMLTQLPASVPVAGSPSAPSFTGRLALLELPSCDGGAVVGEAARGHPRGAAAPRRPRSLQHHPRSVQHDPQPPGGRRSSLFPLAAPRLSVGISYLDCPRSVSPGQAHAVIPPPAEHPGLAPAHRGGGLGRHLPGGAGRWEPSPGCPEGGETFLHP